MVETRQTRCRNCDGIVFTESVPEEHESDLLYSSDLSTKVQYDGISHYLRCPQCSVKNLIRTGMNLNGTPFLAITGIVMDDEYS